MEATITETTHYPFDSTVRLRMSVVAPGGVSIVSADTGLVHLGAGAGKWDAVDVRLSSDGYAKIEKTVG
jgi:hypothetical protein